MVLISHKLLVNRQATIPRVITQAALDILRMSYGYDSGYPMETASIPYGTLHFILVPKCSHRWQRVETDIGLWATIDDKLV